MKQEKKKLPIGIEMFKKIRTAGFYYRSEERRVGKECRL